MLNHIMRGRLGNQLFQYATIRAQQIKNYPNESINFDFSDLKKLGTLDNGFEDSLKYFNVTNYTSKKVICTKSQKILVFIAKVPEAIIRCIKLEKIAEKYSHKISAFIQPILNYFGVYYFLYGYYDFKKTQKKAKCFVGNFESPKYFNEIKDVLLEEFTPKKEPLKNNKSLYDIINKSESVCISIRRGDFVENDEFKKVHFVCDEKYFQEGIKIISEKIKNPTFIVFSDDVNWVKENMEFPGQVYYESGTDPIWEKLRLMYSCKHFIISNSTFSWWAQYLSRNDNKIVVAPSIWKNITYRKYSEKIDIYEEDWILVDINEIRRGK